LGGGRGSWFAKVRRGGRGGFERARALARLDRNWRGISGFVTVLLVGAGAGFASTTGNVIPYWAPRDRAVEILSHSSHDSESGQLLKHIDSEDPPENATMFSYQ
jgi:hypothetical protein